MDPNAVPVRARRLTGALLVVLLAAGAPAVAQAHWHPHPHPGSNGGNGNGSGSNSGNGNGGNSGNGNSGNGSAGGSSSAPATTAVPPSTVTLAPTDADAAAPATVLPGAAAAPAPTDAAPPPELGKTVAFATVSGTVTVRVPGGGSVPLTAAVALPTGTRVDTRAGEVELASALDAAGKTQTGRFSGGVFEVRQPKDRAGLTQIVLVGGHWGDCQTSNYVSRAAEKKKARKPIRKLWGSDDHGKFQTRGGGSVATVRGTRWLTSDTCNGTRTTVLEGAVSVKSRKTGRTRLVTAGHTIFVHR